MKEFPEILDIKNKSNFTKILYDRTLCYLRRDIYEHIISHDENSYFDVKKFDQSHHRSMETTSRLISTIMEELTKLGWKCKLSFQGTGLFIYSTENPPPSCWDDGWD